jgi:hypothetical protein
MKPKVPDTTLARLPEGKTFWQVRIDQKVQRAFKVKCVIVGKSMSQKIEELMREWSSDNDAK